MVAFCGCCFGGVERVYDKADGCLFVDIVV